MEKDRKFVKYDSIASIISPSTLEGFLGTDFEVYEKIDGGNCQIRRFEYEIVPATRSNFLKGPVIHKTEWFGKFVKWTFSNYGELINIPEDKIVFGEWSGNHTISYLPENTDQFFLIDVLDLNNQRFMRYDEGREMLEDIGIECVRYLDPLYKGAINERIVKRLLDKPSSLYFGNKEGLVIKDYTADPQLFLKVYHEDFSEKRLLRNGKIDYLTISRFIKNLHRLLEQEGRKEVSFDELVEETAHNITREENVDLDLKKVKKRLKDYTERGLLSDIQRSVRNNS